MYGVVVSSPNFGAALEKLHLAYRAVGVGCSGTEQDVVPAVNGGLLGC